MDESILLKNITSLYNHAAREDRGLTLIIEKTRLNFYENIES